LPRTLRSVMRQTHTDWECVVVDDGSQDATPELLQQAARADPRIRVVVQAADGVVAARNRGLAECRAPMVALLDADDLMHPRRLELQLAALAAAPQLDGVGSHVRYRPRAGLGEGMRAYEAWLNSMREAEDLQRDRYIEMPVGHPTLMLRRDALAAVGGWRDCGWPEDWDLLLRLMRAPDGEARIGVVPQQLLAWRIRSDSMSRNSEAYSVESFTRCRAAFLAADYLHDADDYALLGYGGTGRGLRRALADHDKQLSTVIEVHPRRIGQTIHGAPVLPPESLRDLRPRKLIVSVAGIEARTRVRALLAEMNYREAYDYVCAA
jgi:glycosyltransferase involved in cell wall biosynthesis